jgi:hypothetical protein
MQSLQYHHPQDGDIEVTVPREDGDIEVTVQRQDGDIEVTTKAVPL